jgi:hypothetical protein
MPHPRSWEKGLLEGPDALAKLAMLAKYWRYKDSIRRRVVVLAAPRYR